jgi:hypothetical protein
MGKRYCQTVDLTETPFKQLILRRSRITLLGRPTPGRYLVILYSNRMQVLYRSFFFKKAMAAYKAAYIREFGE